VKLLVLLVIVAACGCACYSTPPECQQLCERIEAWTKTCKAPVMTKETCNGNYTTDRARGATAMRCWNLLMEWTPNLETEFDCGKKPPALL